MTNQYCRKCGTMMLKRKATSELAAKVKALTGQENVWVFLCPVCYPAKVEVFWHKKKSRFPR